MSSVFIGYNNTLNFRENIDRFMEDNKPNIMNLHKNQFAEEDINFYSTKQYNVLLYQAAYEYCLNLWFFTLEQTQDETLDESEQDTKRIYSFDDIRYNLAHYGIDLNRILEDIKINNSKILKYIYLYNQQYYDYGNINTNISSFVFRAKFSIDINNTSDVSILSFNELQNDNTINSNNSYGLKLLYDISSKRIYIRCSHSVYLWTDDNELPGLNDKLNKGEDIDLVVWLDYTYPEPRYGFTLGGVIPSMYNIEDGSQFGAVADFLIGGSYEFKLDSTGKTILGGIYNGTDILTRGNKKIKYFEIAECNNSNINDMINGNKIPTSIFRLDADNTNPLKDEINGLEPNNI